MTPEELKTKIDELRTLIVEKLAELEEDPKWGSEEEREGGRARGALRPRRGNAGYPAGGGVKGVTESCAATSGTAHRGPARRFRCTP